MSTNSIGPFRLPTFPPAPAAPAAPSTFGLGALVAAVFCGVVGAGLFVGPAPALGSALFDAPLTPADAAIQWRWIGIRSDSTLACPPANNWTARPLFEQADGSAIPPNLAPFCLYEGDPSKTHHLHQLVSAGTLVEVETDFMAVAGLGNSLTRDSWAKLRDHFLDQAGSAAWPTTGGSPPRLAILDTSPSFTEDATDYLTNSPHGYSLVNMADALLCDPTGSCLADIDTRLALAYLDFSATTPSASTRDEAEGGVVGDLGDLAQAIRTEVRSWEILGGAPVRILNLSLGWHGLFGGGSLSASGMPVAVRAVYESLRQASCRGALVVAAAGNRTAGPDLLGGPLFPAAWEQLPAPGLADCEGILGESALPDLFPDPEDPVYRPLVYAAGGLDADGDPLAVARPGGLPRLGAFGDHATVADLAGTGPTGVLTGTSVSAVVISSAAAAVAFYRPGLRADEVMQVLYDSGSSLGVAVDFCLGGAPCPVTSFEQKRVSVCQAVATACADDTLGLCPNASALPACPTWPSSVALTQTDLVTFSPAVTVDLDDDVTASHPLPPRCKALSLLVPPPVTPADPCPQDQYYGLELETWVSPQPRSNPCPSCWGLSAAGSSLFIEIDSEWGGGSLTDATLVIGTSSYNLGLGTLYATDTVLVEDAPTLPDDGTEVKIVFSAGKASASSPVLVVKP